MQRTTHSKNKKHFDRIRARHRQTLQTVSSKFARVTRWSPRLKLKLKFRSQRISVDRSGHERGSMYKDTVSTLICNDCGMSLSNLRIQGTIVVDLQSGSLVSSTMTLSQTSVQRFNMEIRSSGPASGSWSYVMSTTSLGSVTAPGVFTIS